MEEVVIHQFLLNPNHENFSNLANLIDEKRQENYKCHQDTQIAKFYNAKIKNPEMSKHILKQIENEHPDIIEKIHYISPIIRFNSYETDDKLGLHLDTPFDFLVTHVLLLYLNDDYQGGHLRVYDECMKFQTEMIPRAGLGVIMPLSFWHETTKLQRGQKKCVAFHFS